MSLTLERRMEYTIAQLYRAKAMTNNCRVRAVTEDVLTALVHLDRSFMTK